MALWTIESCLIMGACRSWEGKSVFARAPLVVGKSYEKNLLKIIRFPSHEYAEGEQISLEEFDALISGGEALRFDKPIALKQAGTVCWILRLDSYGSTERPDWIFSSLIYNNALLAMPIRGPGTHTFALVIDEEKANLVREVWSTFEISNAGNMARDYRWAEAAACAERADIINLHRKSFISARVVFYLERAGNLVRSQGYLQMLKNSHDAEFVAKVELFMKRLGEKYK